MSMTEVICANKLKTYKPKGQIILNRYHCVEMNLDRTIPIYQFRLYPHSNLNEAYVLIKDNSEILKHLNSGEKVDMLYYPKETDAPAEHFKTQILDITKKKQGLFKGHFMVALSIVN